MNKSIIMGLLGVALFLGMSAHAISKGIAYQCVSQKGNITLQDFSCTPNMKETLLKLQTYSETSSDGLRPLELTLMKRNHDLYVLQKKHEYKLKEQNSKEQLRLEREKAMFDHKLDSFLFYGSRMDYPWSNGYPFGEVGNTYGGYGGYGGYGSVVGKDKFPHRFKDPKLGGHQAFKHLKGKAGMGQHPGVIIPANPGVVINIPAAPAP